jgi:hypothetical protein
MAEDQPATTTESPVQTAPTAQPESGPDFAKGCGCILGFLLVLAAIAFGVFYLVRTLLQRPEVRRSIESARERVTETAQPRETAPAPGRPGPPAGTAAAASLKARRLIEAMQNKLLDADSFTASYIYVYSCTAEGGRTLTHISYSGRFWQSGEKWGWSFRSASTRNIAGDVPVRGLVDFDGKALSVTAVTRDGKTRRYTFPAIHQARWEETRVPFVYPPAFLEAMKSRDAAQWQEFGTGSFRIPEGYSFQVSAEGDLLRLTAPVQLDAATCTISLRFSGQQYDQPLDLDRLRRSP